MAKEVVELTPIEVRHATVTIEGDGELILNKMNARTVRDLMDKQNNNPKDKREPNKWEDIITAIRWKDDLGVEDTYTNCDEEMFHSLLKNNAPCISGFGLKQAIKNAIGRNDLGKLGTKFDSNVNIVNTNNPITFVNAYVDEKIIPAKVMGKPVPVLARQTVFQGWRCTFEINYTTNVFSLNQIVDFIKYAGFGEGIGSGRSSGYGRFHVLNVE